VTKDHFCRNWEYN